MLKPAPLSVSAFLARVNELLETQVAWVEGEVANLRISSDRWLHFDLKDATALVHCFGLAFRLRTPLEDGMKVRIWGVPRIYPRYGKFSLVVERLEPAGEGALRRAFELLRQKLEREGLFDAARRRPLPKVPERLVLLTSPDAAAYADFLKVLAARRGGLNILFVPVPVQGAGAADIIAAALDWVNEGEPDRDALVLIRGGGSLEELHAFNDERVVRALARSRIPTVVGVGHERDVTLADLVADVRASTPSNAAELVTPTRAELDDACRELAARLVRAVHAQLAVRERFVFRCVADLRDTVQKGMEGIDFLVRRVEGIGSLLHARVRTASADLQHVIHLLPLRLRERVQGHGERLAALERLLAGLDPRKILARGYSMTYGPTGSVVRDARVLRTGDALKTRLQRGTLTSVTTSIHGEGDE
ncbi:MAG: exodeoxyribonuclease VII large subunit [Parcubacteria group bacterium Gr01-1014_38]|nr:MAG: exodeoxyribonuclease VII large subunit [Parcubacteria group bacterium Gr01-1014_38]